MAVYALIPCAKQKAAIPCAAWEMYWPSQQFRGAWQVAVARGEVPLILSAKYGLLRPDWPIEPYSETAKAWTPSQRARWGIDVWGDLRRFFHPGDRIVSYLGMVYADALLGWVRGAGFHVEEPIRGLRFGKRLAWFKAQLQGRAA